MCSLYHAVSQINQIKSLMENRLLRARASDRNIQPWLLRDPRVDFLFEDYIPVSFAPELLWKACLVDLRGETERERERGDTLFISVRLHARSRCHWSDHACHRYRRNFIRLTRDAIGRIEVYATRSVVANERLLSACLAICCTVNNSKVVEKNAILIASRVFGAYLKIEMSS